MRSHAATDRRLEARRFRARREELARKVQGRCHCGAISYEAEVEPCTAYICHCQDCQMLTGSAFRPSISAPAESFRILTGTPRRYTKVADSGTRRVHAFCESCGSPIYSCAPDNPRTYALRLWWAEPAGAARPAGAANLDETPAAVDAEARRRAGDRGAALNSRCVRSRYRPAPCPSMRRCGIFGLGGDRYLLGDSPRSSGAMSGCGISNSIFDGSIFDPSPL